MRLALVVLLACLACGHNRHNQQPAHVSAVPSAPQTVLAHTDVTPVPPAVVPELMPCPQVTLGPAMAMGRIGPAIIALNDGLIYAIGGENPEGRLRSSEVFGGSRWETLGRMTVPRVRHTATLLDDDQVLVAGGGFDHPQSRLAELWDGERFVPAGRMLSVRSRHTATRLLDGRVLVIGGRDEHERPIATAEIWDPKTRTWRAAGRSKQARCCHTSTLLRDGRVLVVGGLVGAPCDFDEQKSPCYHTTDSVELWDPRSATFVAAPPLGDDEARAAHTATLLRDGRVMIAGGSSNTGDELGDPADHDLIWDSGSWHLLEASAFRVYHSATLLDDGSVLFIGGQRDLCGCCARAPGSGTGEFASTIVRYDPSADRWTKEGESLVPRDRHGAALLPDGSVLVIGGESEEWGVRGAAFGWTERWTRTARCRKIVDRSE